MSSHDFPLVAGLARFSAPAPWTRETSPDDQRLGHLLGQSITGDAIPRVALLGFPCDEGVRRNGGRFGAAGGPAAIRAALYPLTPDARHPDGFTSLLAHSVDLGDLEIAGDLERDQELLGKVVGRLLDAGIFPVVMGGGHETAYGHFLGYASTGHAVEILNIDAHPDVRELRDGKGHSGSVFRQAITHPSGACHRYTVAGLLPHSVAVSHLRMIAENGGRYMWADEMAQGDLQALYAGAQEPMMVTFDLDAVDRAGAPGVSAPATGGVSVRRWLELAKMAGQSSRVRSVDVVELNPRVDHDGRTSALAAVTIWTVLAGLAGRG